MSLASFSAPEKVRNEVFFASFSAPERSAMPLATRSALPLIRASASLKNGTQESKRKRKKVRIKMTYTDIGRHI